VSQQITPEQIQKLREEGKKLREEMRKRLKPLLCVSSEALNRRLP